MAEAVRKAWDLARPDGVVLLAPACSSFDMFTDYAHRGEAFKDAVRELRTKNEERRMELGTKNAERRTGEREER
jgi:hypothetical protein